MSTCVDTIPRSAPRQGNAEKPTSLPLFAFGLTSVYFLLELINVLHHAMWRDEIQTWSLALRSHSVREFLVQKRYADLGHPDGWHLLVYAVSRLTKNPFAMQFLHLMIATATAYVVARYSPFSRLQKVLIVFGYFLFFEYAAISRNYAIGVLSVFLFCAVFRPGEKKNYLLLGAILALMAQSNIQALMLASALALAILFEGIYSPSPRRFFLGHAGEMAFAAVLFLTSTVISVFRMEPPADATFYPGIHFGLGATSIGRTLAMMWKAFVPIPALSRQFWNTNIIPSPPLVAFLSIFVLGISILFFVRKPIALMAYTSGLAVMLLFRHVKYAGDLRHDGHAFILFLACLWIVSYYPRERFPILWLDRAAARFEPHQSSVLQGVLVVQVIAAVIASAIALKVPFSQAKNTAEFLRSNHLQSMFIVADPDAPLATLAGYLERDIYYPRGDRMGTYVVWNMKRAYPPKEPAVDTGRRKALELHQDVLVILNYTAKAQGPDVQELASFPGSVVRNEDYYVYRVSYLPGAGTDKSGGQ